MSDGEKVVLTKDDIQTIVLNPTTELLHKRRAELEAEKARLVEEVRPFREDYEQLSNDPRLIECRIKIKEMNKLIGPVDNELSQIARALGGKSLSASE